MKPFKALKKLFTRKTILDKEVEAAAEEFKNLDVNDIGNNLTISGGGPVGPGAQGSIPNVVGSPHNPQASYPGYGAGNVHIPNPAHTHQMPTHQMPLVFDEPKTKRPRIVSEQRADIFIEQLNRKIAILIRLRTQSKNQDEIATLTLSIDTLEMTRELVQEVFINQIKDD